MKVATAGPCAACFVWWGLVVVRFLGPSRRLWVRLSSRGFCVADLQAPRELPGQKRVI